MEMRRADARTLAVLWRIMSGTRCLRDALWMNLAYTRTIQFPRRRLQHEYKHAADFGIAGSCNNRRLLAFEAALRQHVEAEFRHVLVDG